MLDGTISWEVFRPREDEPSLSYTLQNESLRTSSGLEQYQRDKELPSGDLPGICKLTHYDLTEALQPPRPPRFEHDLADPKYGHLHCVTDRPHDDVHMEKMAKLATRNGLIRPFVNAPKRAAS